MSCEACFPHGPDDPCSCDGCWDCEGGVVGCTCDIAWDCEHDGQEQFDRQFRAIISAEVTLDNVLSLLARLGFKVEPWQRRIVADWVSESDESEPMADRLDNLRGLLR